MNEQSTPNSVWISREEYDRLRQAESRSLSQMYPTPVNDYGPAHGSAQPSTASIVASHIEEPAVKPSGTTIMSLLLVPLAVGAFVFPPLGLVFLILAVVTIARARKTNNSTASQLATGVLIAAGLIVMAPFLFIMFFLIMFQLNCAFDADACRSA